MNINYIKKQTGGLQKLKMQLKRKFEAVYEQKKKKRKTTKNKTAKKVCEIQTNRRNIEKNLEQKYKIIRKKI